MPSKPSKRQQRLQKKADEESRTQSYDPSTLAHEVSHATSSLAPSLKDVMHPPTATVSISKSRQKPQSAVAVDITEQYKQMKPQRGIFIIRSNFKFGLRSLNRFIQG